MSRGVRRKQRAVVAGAALSIGLLAACGDDGGAPAESEPAGSEAAATGVVIPVVALDNSFRPQQAEAHVGDTVEWENRGINEHNVLTIEGAEWGVEVEGFQPGDVYAHVFTEPGEYAYYCSIHGNESVGMVGTITVLP
jgi:plastocyanin